MFTKAELDEHNRIEEAKRKSATPRPLTIENVIAQYQMSDGEWDALTDAIRERLSNQLYVYDALRAENARLWGALEELVSAYKRLS